MNDRQSINSSIRKKDIQKNSERKQKSTGLSDEPVKCVHRYMPIVRNYGSCSQLRMNTVALLRYYTCIDNSIPQLRCDNNKIIVDLTVKNQIFERAQFDYLSHRNAKTTIALATNRKSESCRIRSLHSPKIAFGVSIDDNIASHDYQRSRGCCCKILLVNICSKAR